MAVDLQTIWELQQDMNSKLDELVEFKAVHAETHRGLEKDIGGFHRTLYGDGEDGRGLTYTVQRLQLNGKARKTERQFLRTFLFGILRTIAAAAIIGVAVWLLTIYKAGPEVHRPETIDPDPAGAAEHSR